MVSRGQVLHSAMTAAILQRSTEKRRTTAKLSKEMTRTFKCTHSFNIKRMCKPYDSPPNTSGLHKTTGSRTVKSSGWEVVFLCNQLGGVNNRQMGNTGSERISNLFTNQPVLEHWPSPAIYSAEQSLLIQEEVSTLLEKGAVLFGYATLTLRRVFIPQSSWSPRKGIR